MPVTENTITRVQKASEEIANTLFEGLVEDILDASVCPELFEDEEIMIGFDEFLAIGNTAIATFAEKFQDQWIRWYVQTRR